MKLTKIIASCAVLAVASAVVFAEGLSVSGYLRSGIENDLDDDVFSADEYKNGYNYGFGSSSLRADVTYENTDGGVTFRLEKAGDLSSLFSSYSDDNEDGAITDGEEYSFENNVAWAMAYANLFNGFATVEAGILTDRFTTTGGDWDSGIDGSKGARLVLFPVEGLTLTAQAATNFAEKRTSGSTATNKKLVSFSGKYETEDFFVTGGYALAKYGYASLGITAIENLTAVFEYSYDDTDDTDGTDNSVDPISMYALTLDYAKDAFDFGVIGYYYTDNATNADEDFTADKQYDSYAIYPFASYAINDTFTAACEVGFTGNDAKVGGVETDDEVLVTPSVVFNASKSAKATAYYTWAKEGNPVCGTTVKVTF